MNRVPDEKKDARGRKHCFLNIITMLSKKALFVNKAFFFLNSPSPTQNHKINYFNMQSLSEREEIIIFCWNAKNH